MLSECPVGFHTVLLKCRLNAPVKRRLNLLKMQAVSFFKAQCIYQRVV